MGRAGGSARLLSIPSHGSGYSALVGGLRMRWRFAALAAAALAAPALALAAGRAADALAKLERGRWLIRSANQAALERQICVRDQAVLFQVEHGPNGCRQELVEEKENRATVEYVCPGRGFGHTSVRIESSKTATIETQGFIDGRPFAYRATARKLSDC